MGAHIELCSRSILQKPACHEGTRNSALFPGLFSVTIDKEEREKNRLLEALGRNASLLRAPQSPIYFDGYLGGGTTNKMNFFFARNRNLRNSHSLFEPERQVLADRHLKLLPKAFYRLAAFESETGVAAIFKLVRCSGFHFCQS